MLPFAQRPKAKPSARALQGARAFGFQRRCVAGHDRQRITATRIGHRPLRAAVCAYGALVSSLEVLQSMEVPLLRNRPDFVHFPIHISPFCFHIERFRSLPLEKLSPKSFSNDHTDSSSRKSITFDQ